MKLIKLKDKFILVSGEEIKEGQIINKMKKEEKNIKEARAKALSKTNVICCGALEQMNLRWMYLADQTKCMPHIKNIQEDKDFRVNFCPVCGKNVRSAIIKP